jgi:Trypsin-like peptidase domain
MLDDMLKGAPMKPAPRVALFSSLMMYCAAGMLGAAAGDDSRADISLRAAVCPVVYRLDESPAANGYRYTFFGNAFFINDQGYLLTAAHVLETFKNGGRPSILLTRPNGPPQLIALTVIAADTQHDVAILRANPNPFSSHYSVTFLPVAPEPAVPGESVLAISLHPSVPGNAQSFQLPVEDRSSGTVLSIEQTQLAKSAPPADIFLLSHPVTLGQSGSPVLAADSHSVVGLIEGRWVRDSSISIARAGAQSLEPPGAAIPIRYAISLLERNDVSYHAARSSPNGAVPSAKQCHK